MTIYSPEQLPSTNTAIMLNAWWPFCAAQADRPRPIHDVLIMVELKSVERVQTRLHLERRPLNVMYGVVELHEIGLGDLVEGVMLHAFKGTLPFGQASLEGNLRFPSGYQRTHVR